MAGLFRFTVLVLNGMFGLGQATPDGFGVIIPNEEFGVLSDWFDCMVFPKDGPMELVFNECLVAASCLFITVPLAHIVGSISGGGRWDPVKSSEVLWDFKPVPMIPFGREGSIMGKASPFFEYRFNEIYFSIWDTGWHLDFSVMSALFVFFPLEKFAVYLGCNADQLHNIQEHAYLWAILVLLINGFKSVKAFCIEKHREPSAEVQEMAEQVGNQLVGPDWKFPLVFQGTIPQYLLQHHYWHPNPSLSLMADPNYPSDFINRQNWIGNVELPYQPTKPPEAFIDWFYRADIMGYNDTVIGSPFRSEPPIDYTEHIPTHPTPPGQINSFGLKIEDWKDLI
jgi:hypothetical protein